MHCVAGLDRLTSGRVLRPGETDLSTLDDKGLTTLRRDRVGFIFQTFNLFRTLTAIENITLPMDPWRDVNLNAAWVDPVIDTLGIRDRLKHKPPSELSGGQQQRVAVGRALLSRPRSSSATSRPETSTPTRRPICSPSSAGR